METLYKDLVIYLAKISDSRDAISLSMTNKKFYRCISQIYPLLKKSIFDVIYLKERVNKQFPRISINTNFDEYTLCYQCKCVLKKKNRVKHELKCKTIIKSSGTCRDCYREIWNFTKEKGKYVLKRHMRVCPSNIIKCSQTNIRNLNFLGCTYQGPRYKVYEHKKTCKILCLICNTLIYHRNHNHHLHNHHIHHIHKIEILII